MTTFIMTPNPSEPSIFNKQSGKIFSTMVKLCVNAWFWHMPIWLRETHTNANTHEGVTYSRAESIPFWILNSHLLSKKDSYGHFALVSKWESALVNKRGWIKKILALLKLNVVFSWGIIFYKVRNETELSTLLYNQRW